MPKRCSGCKKWKPLNAFSKCRDGHQTRCKECRPSDYTHAARTVAQIRADNLKKKFGITVEEYDAMFKEQRGRCAICGFPPIFGTLHVDHCHDTLKVRGLLCKKCNTGIGMFRDDPEVMQAAIEYILKHKE